jgi:MFS superfamily sulfate permease-like transporter
VTFLAGAARLGFVTELLSKRIRYGYMNGIALTVLISQVPKLLGFSIESQGIQRDLWAIAGAVLEGRTNWVAFLVGAGSLAVILLLKGVRRVPGVLVAVAGATVIGQGQAEALRAVRAAWRRDVLSDHRSGGQQLSCGPPRGLGGLGRSESVKRGSADATESP